MTTLANPVVDELDTKDAEKYTDQIQIIKSSNEKSTLATADDGSQEKFTPRTLALIDDLGLRLMEDNYLKWKPDALDHPRNWSVRRKTFDVGLVLMLDLFTTAVSTAGPSAAEVARIEYGVSKTIALVALGSMYQLGQAFGGVLFPPYSEAFGRKSVYIISSLIYCLSCLLVGLPHSLISSFLGRFISGFMSAVPSIIVSGSIEDMFDVKQRIWMMYIWACFTTGGLLLGPVYGSYISLTLGWRWIFHLAALITFIFTILLFFIRESRQSQLLQIRLMILKQEIPTAQSVHLKINNPDHTPSLSSFANDALRRPVVLFFTEPLVFVISIMSATGWALIYLFTTALPTIFFSPSLSPSFTLSHQQSSLLFLFMALGLPFGIIPRLIDHRILLTREKESVDPVPEDKLTGFTYAAPALAAGLWWLSLVIPPASTLPWYASLPAFPLIGFATNEFACVLSSYLADTYTIYAASAFAAMGFLRAILGGVFPLVGEPMVESLGPNWAVIVVAGVATLFCAAPGVFGRFGRGLRIRSEFARYSERVGRETGIEDRGGEIDQQDRLDV